MACPCSSDEDYHNYETDSEDIGLEDSPDESDSDYDPEKEIGESDSDISVEKPLSK